MVDNIQGVPLSRTLGPPPTLCRGIYNKGGIVK